MVDTVSHFGIVFRLGLGGGNTLVLRIAESRVEISHSVLSHLLAKPSDSKKAGFFVECWLGTEKRNSAYSLALQRDFEGVLRIWEGKSRHRPKNPCINSVNMIKTQLGQRFAFFATPKKLADLTIAPWHGCAASQNCRNKSQNCLMQNPNDLGRRFNPGRLPNIFSSECRYLHLPA